MFKSVSGSVGSNLMNQYKQICIPTFQQLILFGS